MKNEHLLQVMKTLSCFKIIFLFFLTQGSHLTGEMAALMW